MQQPPVLWQREADGVAAAAAAAAAAGAGAVGAAGALPPGSPPGALSAAADSEERAADCWRHVKQVAREGAKEHDLLDLLQNARREETYSFAAPGWPAALRPVSGAMRELPAMVQDRYRTCQTMCFCGVFPEIRRAWASVDNSLFLWRYDKRCAALDWWCSASSGLRAAFCARICTWPASAVPRILTYPLSTI